MRCITTPARPSATSPTVDQALAQLLQVAEVNTATSNGVSGSAKSSRSSWRGARYDGALGGFRDEVKDLTDGRGADVIYDPVGGDVFDESMRCINLDGRLLTIGFTSGRWPQAPVNLILIKQISVIGVRAGEYGRLYPERGVENDRAVYDLAASGAIQPYVCEAFPLAESVAALQMLADRNVVGKCVVTMNGYEFDPAAG